MDTNDIGTNNADENKEPKKSLAFLERIRRLGKLKPLNLTKPMKSDIVLEAPIEVRRN